MGGSGSQRSPNDNHLLWLLPEGPAAVRTCWRRADELQMGQPVPIRGQGNSRTLLLPFLPPSRVGGPRGSLPLAMEASPPQPAPQEHLKHRGKLEFAGKLPGPPPAS